MRYREFKAMIKQAAGETTPATTPPTPPRPAPAPSAQSWAERGSPAIREPAYYYDQWYDRNFHDPGTVKELMTRKQNGSIELDDEQFNRELERRWKGTTSFPGYANLPKRKNFRDAVGNARARAAGGGGQQAAPAAQASGAPGTGFDWGSPSTWLPAAKQKFGQVVDDIKTQGVMNWLKGNWHWIVLPAGLMMLGNSMAGKNNKMMGTVGGIAAGLAAAKGVDWLNSAWNGTQGGQAQPQPKPVAGNAQNAQKVVPT